ncbi:MAG: hypothetical protein RDV48_21585 [Candidatus Eremiobacteraeota bacterium]|nr:hypothetical protein [Candidatus Eremiobacteraeota bacterium]
MTIGNFSSVGQGPQGYYRTGASKADEPSQPPQDPQPPPPQPPPQPPPVKTEFSPLGLGYSIPAYSAAAANAIVGGISSHQAAAQVAAPATPGAAVPPGAAGVAPESLMGKMAPWMSGFASGMIFLKSGHELYQGIKEGNSLKIISGSLDAVLGVSCLLTAIPALSAYGALTTGVVLGTKILTDAINNPGHVK